MNTPLFMPWTPWVNRCDIKHCDQPGVYVLARFDGGMPAKVEPISRAVVYIGETCSQTLADRWSQFNTVVCRRKGCHSGGWTFSAKYCGSAMTLGVPWLYVAALPVLMKEPHQSAYIRYIERWLIWDYVQAFDALPSCNTK